VRELMGTMLFNVGLLAMLASYLTAYGLGLKSGLIAAVAAPMLAIGFLLERSRERMMVFAVAVVMGCGWLLWIAFWSVETLTVCRLSFARCLFGAGVVILLASVSVLPGIGAFAATAGLALVVAGVILARRRTHWTSLARWE